VECGPRYHQGTSQDKVQWTVVLSTIRELVKIKCSGVWSSIPSGNLSGQNAVECGSQYHQRTCKDKVQWSVVLDTIREPVIQSAVECVPQYHQRTCKDKLQWSVVLNTIRACQDKV